MHWLVWGTRASALTSLLCKQKKEQRRIGWCEAPELQLSRACSASEKRNKDALAGSQHTQQTCRVGQNPIYIYGVYTVFLAEESSNIRSYTVYIYGIGQPYKHVFMYNSHAEIGSNLFTAYNTHVRNWTDVPYYHTLSTCVHINMHVALVLLPNQMQTEDCLTESEHCTDLHQPQENWHLLFNTSLYPGGTCLRKMCKVANEWLTGTSIHLTSLFIFIHINQQN
jgi:hypothetical protein